MADVRGVSMLEEELAKAKEVLKDVDENIKKLIGRDPGESRPGQRRVSAPGGEGNFGGRGRLFAAARRSLGEPTGPPAKRRALGGAFSRLGPRLAARQGQGRDSGGEDDDPESKPAVQSSVVATPKDTRTRQDMIKAQNKDPEGKARNRRMFGILLGTLQSFQKDSRVKDEKVQQRKAIEEKLEQKAVEEKEKIRKERQSLFNQRKKEQAKLRRLEQKMELVKIHKEWEAQTKKLMNFARTKAKPHIYYQPKTHTSATEKKVKETAKILEGIVEERRKQLEEEIEELTKKDEEHKDTKVEEEEEEDEDDDREQEDDNIMDTSIERLEDEANTSTEKNDDMKADNGADDIDTTVEEKENQKDVDEGKDGKQEGKESKESRDGGRKVEKREHKSHKESERDSRSKRHSESDKRHSSGDKKRERHNSSSRDKRSNRDKRSDDKHKDDKDKHREGKHKDDKHSSRDEQRKHRQRSTSPSKSKDEKQDQPENPTVKEEKNEQEKSGNEPDQAEQSEEIQEEQTPRTVVLANEDKNDAMETEEKINNWTPVTTEVEASSGQN